MNPVKLFFTTWRNIIYKIFHIGDVPHQWPRVFHLNFWRITNVWNVTTLSQRIDNTIESPSLSISHKIALNELESV
jgi:hypothetical protein